MNLLSGRIDQTICGPARSTPHRLRHLENVMENRMHWADRPLWVRAGLFGVPSRKTALLWMNGALAFAVLVGIAILAMPVSVNGIARGIDARALYAGLVVPPLLIAPLWYWLAIRWTDEHDGWTLHSWKS
jgi:hypothetical protein